MIILLFALLAILILVCAWFVVLPALAIRTVTRKCEATSQKLRLLEKNRPEYPNAPEYDVWRQKAPEVLWAKVMASTVGERVRRGKLAGKIVVACDGMHRVLQLDYTVHSWISSGAISFSDVETVKTERNQLVAVVQQALDEVEAELSL